MTSTEKDRDDIDNWDDHRDEDSGGGDNVVDLTVWACCEAVIITMMRPLMQLWL